MPETSVADGHLYTAQWILVLPAAALVVLIVLSEHLVSHVASLLVKDAGHVIEFDQQRYYIRWA